MSIGEMSGYLGRFTEQKPDENAVGRQETGSLRSYEDSKNFRRWPDGWGKK